VLNAPPAAPLYRASGFVQCHSSDITDGNKIGANDPKRSFCPEQTWCEQFGIASDQSPMVSVIDRGGYCYECRQKTLARQERERMFG
jgi:hypothetical protein